MVYLDALAVLLKKNLKLAVRDLVSLAVQLVSPLFVILLLFAAQKSFDNNVSFTPELRVNQYPEPSRVGLVPKCSRPTDGACYSLAYVYDGSVGDFPVDTWVNNIAEEANISQNQVRNFSSSSALNLFLLENPNTTNAAFIFEQYNLNQMSSKTNISFTVQYNTTPQDVFPIGVTDFNEVELMPSLITAMNAQIMSSFLNRKVQFEFYKKIFPHPDLPGKDDAFQNYGPFLLYGCFILSFQFFLYRLALEKENRNRVAMKLAGMYQSQHYLSWGLPFALSMLFTSLLLIAFGYIFQFDFFKETNFGVTFITFFLFGLALIPWIFFFELLVKSAQSVSLLVFSFFFVTYLIASSQELIYGTSVDGRELLQGGVRALRQVFAILPPTMFIRCVQLIVFGYVVGGGIQWENIDDLDIFSIRTCWIWMAFTSAAVLLLTVYLDNALLNRLGPFYFLKASRWRKKSHENLSSDYLDQVYGTAEFIEPTAAEQTSFGAAAGEVVDADVTAERKLIDDKVKTKENCAVIIDGIVKQYGSFRAVDDVSFAVRHNSLFALLGHNGAGKTTLFSMLTGANSITEGDAHIYGYSVKRESDSVRSILGVCPQHDILWDTLSAGEHIEIFAALKGVPKRERASEISRRLEQVELLDVKDKFAGQLSGGMQRRLSVAISLTGDPKIVFLDEPTTGMDPVSRRQVWEMIETAKRGRVLVLVTHSMEEADVLGDMVGIMARGKLRVLGTSLRLKNKFGAGYKLVTLSSKSAPVLACLKDVCPSVSELESVMAPDGGTISEFSLPRSELYLLKEVLLTLERRQSELGIRSFSVSQSTLEEVFVRITSLVAEDNPQETTERKCLSWPRLPFCWLWS